jgi:serine/threonine protein kinase/tetratricopeptide (TPR) repeat protein
MTLSARPVSGSASMQHSLAELIEQLSARLERGEPIDMEACLAAHPEHAEELRRLLPALDLLAHYSRSGPASFPPSVSQGDTAEPPSRNLGDYRLIREVGRGGMGVVYEAEQISLGRRVALKVLPLAATMDPRHLQRFHNEARAAANLHHSNIVPVHGVGCEQGVHYFSMQFIDGRTLAQVIAQQRAPQTSHLSTIDHQQADANASTASPASPSTSTPPSDAAYFRQVAQWGIQAAEALDYAHTLGVVHRDVKPANLIVDTTGRLWVTDFGLAQVQSDARLTMTGDLVGTLHYMSPEQALARRVPIDHRTDVYSLGATFYELLTLQPTFDGEDRQELLRQIAFEEPSRPRRLERGIPVELETIVLKALEKSPTDRYATAQEMADDLQRFLRDEPIRARRPPLWLQLRKWGRRHRPLVASLAVGMMTLLLVGVAMAIGYQRRLAETERGVTAALVQAETHVEEGDKLIDQPERWQATARLAQAALEKAEELLAVGEATGSLTRRVENVRAAVAAAVADSKLLVAVDRIRLEEATFKNGRFDDARAARLYAKVLADHGIDLAAPEAAAARIRESRVRDGLLASLADWHRITDDERERHQLEQVLDTAAPPEDFTTQWREAIRRRDGRAMARWALALPAQRLPAAILCNRARELGSVKEWAAAEQLLRTGLESKPGDFWLNHELGLVLLGQGPARAEEAVGYLRVARALRMDNPGAHLNLGRALQDKGDLEGAIQCYRAALRLDPNYVEAHTNLGTALYSKEDVDAAIAAYSEALRLDNNHPKAHVNLGVALCKKGKLEEAIAEYQTAIRLNDNSPEVHLDLGNALRDQGKLDVAIGEYQTAIQLEKDFDAVHHGRALASAHHGLGLVLLARKDVNAAIAEFGEAIRLKPDYAEAHYYLGNALHEKGDRGRAIAAYQEAIRLKNNYPEACDRLGLEFYQEGELDTARTWLKKAIALDPRYVPAHFNLGLVLMTQKDFEGAIACFRQVLALDPRVAGAHGNLGVAHFNLGNVLRDKGEVDGAIAQFREAIQFNKDIAEAYCNLGQALRDKGQFAEAMTYLRRGHELGSPRRGWSYPSEKWVKECERLVELDARLPRVLKGESPPAGVEERIALAGFCQLPCKSLYAAAARFYTDAFAEQSQLADDMRGRLRYDAARAAAQAGCGQGKDADQTDAKERRRLRQQALKWLQADLAAYLSFLQKDPDKVGPVIVNRLQHWQQDTDFAGVRGPEALATLPEPERLAWQQLWADVADLLARARKQAAPAQQPGGK